MHKFFSRARRAFTGLASAVKRTKRTVLADLATAAGGALVALGVGLIFAPAGVIIGGSLLAAFGLLILDVDKP